MAWLTTEDGRRVNTEWFDKEDQQKYEQIAKNQEEAESRNSTAKSEDDIFKRDKFFDKTVYEKLPKKMQVKNIVSIGKERHGGDGVRYNASVKWEDGFGRSVSEYGWTDFKDYLKTVLFEDREYQQ